MRGAARGLVLAALTLAAAGAGATATGASAAPVSGSKTAALQIRNVTLLDGTGAAPRRGVTVEVQDGKVFAIHRQGSAGSRSAPAGTEVIDGRGKFLIPGLIDTHVHLQGGRLPTADGGVRTDPQLALRTLHGYLYCGVTSIVDQGNAADFIFGLRDAERAGNLLAPRLFATGANITVPGGYGDNAFSLKVADLAADRAAILRHFARRPDIQKFLYDDLVVMGRRQVPVMSDTLFAQVVTMAHDAGIRTTVHVVDERGASAAIAAGIDALSHTVRTSQSGELLTLIRDRQLPVSTTLTVLAQIARVADDSAILDGPLFRATVEPVQLATQKSAERDRYIESGMSARFKTMLPVMAANARRLHEAGVPLALGTDRTWGASVHMELALLEEAGIPRKDLLRIATLNGAAYLGRERELGSIEPGKWADMLLLTANPLEDVAAYGAIDMVFKGGQRIDRRTLDVPANRREGAE